MSAIAITIVGKNWPSTVLMGFTLKESVNRYASRGLALIVLLNGIGAMTVAECVAIDDGRLNLYVVLPGTFWQLYLALPFSSSASQS
jgi:hypothetical protein